MEDREFGPSEKFVSEAYQKSDNSTEPHIIAKWLNCGKGYGGDQILRSEANKLYEKLRNSNIQDLVIPLKMKPPKLPTNRLKDMHVCRVSLILISAKYLALT